MNVRGVRELARARTRGETCFYGDNQVTIYVGTKHDYADLDAVAAAVARRNQRNWIARSLDAKVAEDAMSLAGVISACGSVSPKTLRRLFPWREYADIETRRACTVYRRDGNFAVFALESSRLYYVVCFATS